MTINHESTESIEIESTTLTATEIARYLEIDPKSLRSFIRRNDAIQSQIDHNHRDRYSFTADDARLIIAAFRNRSNRPAAANRSIDAIRALID